MSSVFTRLIATCSAFLFVLAWHGFNSSNYFFWVSLNTLGVSLEYFGYNIISQTKCWHVIKHNLGPINSWRVEALAQLVIVVPGLFGMFFFLGGEGVGADMFMGIFWQGISQLVQPWKLDWGCSGCMLLQMLVICYCSNNVCMLLEQKLNPCKTRSKKDNVKSATKVAEKRK
uniref:Uncharacterized protein n=1 Tax=Ditylenchus dipsaci TaxID=166011 RepID=A0A915ER10_9BILA